MWLLDEHDVLKTNNNNNNKNKQNKTKTKQADLFVYSYIIFSGPRASSIPTKKIQILEHLMN